MPSGDLLIETLLECPFELFAPHEAAVLALPLDEKDRHKLQLRRTVEGLSDDEIWQRLRALADALNKHQEPWRSQEYRETEQLVRAAADRSALAGRVMERVNGLGDEFDFLDVCAVRLAARMRLAEALLPLIEFLTDCDEGWHDDLLPALQQFGSDECVRLIREHWTAGDWNFRYTASCVLGAIHTDASVTACLELAAIEPHPYSQESAVHRLLESAVENFDTAAIEPARQHLLKAPHTRQSKFMYETDLRNLLVDACTLMGERFPEYDKWRREEIEAAAAARRRMAGTDPLLPLEGLFGAGPPEKPALPPDTIVGKATAGRNDPCPCGSGKKFKKCHGK